MSWLSWIGYLEYRVTRISKLLFVRLEKLNLYYQRCVYCHQFHLHFSNIDLFAFAVSRLKSMVVISLINSTNSRNLTKFCFHYFISWTTTRVNELPRNLCIHWCFEKVQWYFISWTTTLLHWHFHYSHQDIKLCQLINLFIVRT